MWIKSLTVEGCLSKCDNWQQASGYDKREEFKGAAECLLPINLSNTLSNLLNELWSVVLRWHDIVERAEIVMQPNDKDELCNTL